MKIIFYATILNKLNFVFVSKYDGNDAHRKKVNKFNSPINQIKRKILIDTKNSNTKICYCKIGEEKVCN